MKNQTITKAQLDSVSYEDVLRLRELRSLRNEITEALTLKQFKPMMFKTHHDFATSLKSVTKSKRLLNKSAQMLSLWNLIKASV